LTPALRPAYLVALAAAWLGYFSPWVRPVPAGLHLSAHDLVEWMTFVQTVRDGTYAVTRLDLLWPLSGIALLSALCVSRFQPAQSVLFRLLDLGFLALALLAAFLILPAYPFVLTAYRDPELAPQFWLGVVSAIAALAVWVLAVRRRGPARVLIPIIALLALLAAVRAVLIVRPPIAEMLAGPLPIGYGWVLAVLGLGMLVVLSGVEMGRGLYANRGNRN
jgi:hypothetical protein